MKWRVDLGAAESHVAPDGASLFGESGEIDVVDDGWRRLTSTLPTLDKGSDVCTTTAAGQVLSSVRREGKEPL